MKRGPLLTVILTIELLVAVVLVYNYTFLLERLSLGGGNSEAVSDGGSAVQQQAGAGQAVVTSAPADAQPVATLSTVADSGANPASQPRGQLIPELSPAVLSLFDPLPSEATPRNYQLSEELVRLGKALFYDPRLSVDQRQSCHTCHVLDRYGVDGLPVSIGHDGEPVKRNSPTVYNAALHIAQFWDGRAATVEDQAKAPILSSGEMGMLDPQQVESTLRSLPGYRPLFTAAFPGQEEPIIFENAAVAIAAFERRLLTPARFDRFLAGDYTQLTEQEQRGLATFAELGCPTCHVGVTVGGLLYKKLGEVEPYPIEDMGRYLVTGVESDRYVFKVPSLRNAAKTAPYLHNGSVATLEEMVVLMARHQLGKEVTDTQVADIVAFISSLTGEIPHEYIAPPPLP
ncbi:MAG TPA: cytochrome c peroxidase [Caldilineaceae bacterium]|nr:cytochrome c peroxidase [Caldilineaceae bacterium]